METKGTGPSLAAEIESLLKKEKAGEAGSRDGCEEFARRTKLSLHAEMR